MQTEKITFEIKVYSYVVVFHGTQSQFLLRKFQEHKQGHPLLAVASSSLDLWLAGPFFCDAVVLRPFSACCFLL